MGNLLSCTLFGFSSNLNPTCFQGEDALDRKNLVDFQHDWGLLKAARVDVMNKIEIEERQQMRRTEEVNQWLQRITKLEGPAETLIDAYTPEYANKCFCGYCRKNYIKCFEFEREMAPMVREVTELLELRPNVVAERILIAPTQELQTEPTLCGVELMLEEAMSQIHDDEKVGIIGLSGMGGVGKTTLLKEINNKLCNSNPKSFDLLHWVVVSKTPNLEEIQNSIGRKIGLHDGEWNRSQEQKKSDIFNVLRKYKYIMLLDDLWDRFDLTKVGLPHPTVENQSKVIFTTRSKTVCAEMKAREIQVKCLTQKESWDLFQDNVTDGTLNAHPDIPELAKVVMNECKGLPLALIVIGRAMACKKSLHSWKLAIKTLKSNVAAHQFPQREDEVFSLLKYSYDSLPNDHIKSCFLYCSLYPEDEILYIDEIIDKWICEGYLDRFNDLYDARSEGHDYISTLVNASLLEECSPELFKLHDVIRDMSIWIGCECGEIKDKFLVQTRCDLRQISNDVNWGSVERMSFIGNAIEELTEIPNCSKTLTMFLGSNNLRLITNRFFQSFRNIRVLDLSGNKRLEVLPNTICDLVHLQCLDLSHTSIKELPVEFKKLVALKYLNLRGTKIFYNIREGELRSCKKLQMLCLERDDFDSSRENSCVEKVLKDLDSSESLKDLSFSINCETSLSKFTSSVNLLSITTRFLLYHFDDSRYLNFSFLERMKHLDSLFLKDMKNLEIINVRSGFYFNNLCRLLICSCPELKDLTWIAFAPNIEEISVKDCFRMKILVGGSVWDEHVNEPERRIPFSKLKTLDLSYLSQLESICPTSLPFPRLSELNVGQSKNLKKLPFNSDSCNGGQVIVTGNEDWWFNLQWEDEATRIKFSSAFVLPILPPGPPPPTYEEATRINLSSTFALPILPPGPPPYDSGPPPPPYGSGPLPPPPHYDSGPPPPYGSGPPPYESLTIQM